MAHPLIIDADIGDVRLIDSALGLRNKATVLGHLRHNQEFKAKRQAEASKRLDPLCEMGAEFIKDSSNSSRERKPEDYANYYGINPHAHD